MKKIPPPAQLKKDIHQAFKHFHKVQEPPDNLLSNLVLVQETQKKESAKPKRYCVNVVLEKGLTQLENHQAEGAQILRKRFLDNKSISEVDKELGLSSLDRVKHKQSSAFSELTQIIWDLEFAARNALITAQKSKLEAKSYTELFGIDKLHKELRNLLMAEASPWVVTLAGIGGIGKTSLANFTVRHVIERLHYHDVVWLKISEVGRGKRPYPTPQTFDKLIGQLCQKMLPALSSQTSQEERLFHLQQLLKSQRFLIIIDDLELQEDTAYLISELVALSNPSRFLLTSRTKPAPHAGSQSISLPELTEVYSLALIRHYAEEIGFAEAVQANDKELLPMYKLVGGNPFCLKQLVNLARHRPLKSLLDSLGKRPLDSGDGMYQHILKETWLGLSDDAKTVLAVMTLATEAGMDADQIAKLSVLPDARLWPAINELIGRSLLEIRSSTLWERSYGIHRLTELFLRSLMNGGSDEDTENDDV
ncbi:NB-ARC domain-containing protein [Candidatus Leptofilum sp.]|uniref:NB-ARC domain-containing protein n=1 Tax=Candidatus Leptofilum sp. TaxID=3241576 RepID=UPI003B58EA00